MVRLFSGLFLLGLVLFMSGCSTLSQQSLQPLNFNSASLPNNQLLNSIASSSNSESINLMSYIKPKDYAKVTLDNNLDGLFYESKIITYPIKRLYNYTYNKLCNNVYWYNCKSNISNLLSITGVNVESFNSFNHANVESVVGYRVRYITPDYNNSVHQVSGAVLIPQTKEKLKGVVIVYHHTVLDKKNAPSNFTKDFFNQSLMLASTMSSNGYVVIMPDYIGVGSDESSVHPYIIYPEVNALSGIYMLPLVHKLESSLDYRLINNKIPLYVSGYSEGSSYALWATKILQDNPQYLAKKGYELRRVAPIDGAYNLSNVMMSTLLTSQESHFGFQEGIIQRLIRPGLVANVLVSYNYLEARQDESNIFAPQFTNCQESNCLYQLIQESGYELDKYQKIYAMAKKAGYATNGDSVLPLINSNLLESDSLLLKRFQAADIYNWHVDIPLNLITLQKDSVVSELNSYTAYIAMRNLGSNNLNLTVVPNENFYNPGLLPFTDMVVNHSGFTLFGYIIARKFFDDDYE